MIRNAALALLFAVQLPAQGNAIVDSATAARAAYRRATAALQTGDLTTAKAEVDRAASAWPTQEAYLWGRVAIAARLKDTLAVVSALRAYAAIGLGRDLKAEPAVAPFLVNASVARAARLHEDNRQPVGRSTVRATIPDSTLWPEGMDHDAVSGSYFVASIRHRTIVEIRRDGSTRDVIPRDQKKFGAVFGVRVDAKNRVLWATTSGVPQMEGFVPGDSAISALLKIRMSDGAIARRWDLPVVPGGHVLGDLAIGPRGDIYVTDSQYPLLHVLPTGVDTLTTITDPLFRSLQGIAPAPDGKSIYVADYSHGILRVDRATRSVTRVIDAPGSTSLGCDGLAWDRGAIVAVQNGVQPARVMRFSLSADGLRFTKADVIDRNTGMADEPTIGAVVGGDFVYVANSQWEKRDEKGTPRPGAAIKRPVLLAVPLPR
jgi:sugar lactone lactonase YvrE